MEKNHPAFTNSAFRDVTLKMMPDMGLRGRLWMGSWYCIISFDRHCCFFFSIIVVYIYLPFSSHPPNVDKNPKKAVYINRSGLAIISSFFVLIHYVLYLMGLIGLSSLGVGRL
jgi:hypothetical protein